MIGETVQVLLACDMKYDKEIVRLRAERSKSGEEIASLLELEQLPEETEESLRVMFPEGFAMEKEGKWVWIGSELA